MTDGEMADKWVKEHCDDSLHSFRGQELREAFMAGLNARLKWHKISDGDLPKENKLCLVAIKDNGLAVAYFNGRHWETKFNLGDFGHCVETVIAWCEPEYTEE